MTSCRIVVAVCALGAASCASASLVLTPLAPPPAACTIDGCASDSSASALVSAPVDCRPAGGSPCGGAPARECTSRALKAWSGSQDDRAISCVAQMLGEACTLGDPQACAFAGRMWVDGRGVASDVERGIEMLVRACDGGVPLACAVAVRWLDAPTHARVLKDPLELRARLEIERACLAGEPGEPCYEAGRCFYFGRNAFPRDRALAVEEYQRGCNIGDSRACNNLGDALAYGEGVERDVARSAAMFERACHLGEELGCANLGHMFEHGQGVARDRSLARDLFRAACKSGEIYGCLHAEMVAAEDAGAPHDPLRALSYWIRACAASDARACAFVGVMYEDGPDDLTRDTDKSLEAMNRGCRLGNGYACQWVKEH
ncbi:MAG TPA: tetratricopeptide repeat protein [Polyangiaceae bacterium]|nr:tetratricopeptide repeat protein [Polyangiaceae bacterium]